MGQEEMLAQIRSTPGIFQRDILRNGNESKQITQLVRKGLIIRVQDYSVKRNPIRLYPVENIDMVVKTC